ncbi:hypothetical protein OG758_30205 [Streptomyces sp. NBC_01474]|uniref:hypothetical protein n=1 Tax=Streptomyces TaxID=1883 RepID=UPI002DD9A738|nr:MULTISPECIES: hypothetical protein [unclassified Streptomyces]WSD98050.1 hypothetical protein OG758_30205 [Streptomyces sp. NBC_01474]
MLNPIARLIKALLRLAWPASGRHRQHAGAPPNPAPAAPTPPRRPSPHAAPLRGEDSRLVRPYLLAHEQREQAKRQRGRRRTLWLAVHGVDIGPRRIPGVEVVA